VIVKAFPGLSSIIWEMDIEEFYFWLEGALEGIDG
jgi:hypothetical protein